MNLLNETKKLCQQYNIHPARSKGQNFLINIDFYDSIIEIADLKAGDIVLEVGPGLGFLTEKLAKKAKQVIAVELDKKLVEVLKSRLGEQKTRNVKVLNDNILDLSIDRIFDNRQSLSRVKTRETIDNPKVVANLPYNITSIFLRKFLTDKIKPQSMVLMLQKEVAERIVAQPPKMSLLAVSVQFYAQTQIIQYVNKENFWPRPKVDSAVITIAPFNTSPLSHSYDRHSRLPNVSSTMTPHSHDPHSYLRDVRSTITQEKQLFRLVKIGFSARRKMLKNNLAAGYQISQNEAKKIIKKAGFRENIRAQELEVKDWLKIFGFLRQNML